MVDLSNVATTCEKPNLETERTLSNPGNPPMDNSTGCVICCSTSNGLSDGATVLICTCTGVVSRKASIGSKLNARAPMMMSTTASRQISRRLRSEKLMSQFSMVLSLASGSHTRQHQWLTLGRWREDGFVQKRQTHRRDEGGGQKGRGESEGGG